MNALPNQPDRTLFKAELETELTNILSFWTQYSLDHEQGGFIGRLDSSGQIDPEAPKGSVLNARILWTFSAAYCHTGNTSYLLLADRAYTYFTKHFLDATHGGVYWSLTSAGQPLDTRKQIYSIAFGIYALSEYFRLSEKNEALQLCISLYTWIEKYSYDPEHGGYLEAFDQKGTLLTDLRLSDKDRNDPKTMNTHLHILEGYTNLYRVWPDADLRRKIQLLLANFQTHILDAETQQMRLFFTANWQPTANLVSFGHDIEASWLLLAAAEAIGDQELINQFKETAVNMAQATIQGVQPDGSLYHELNRDTNHLDTHREWWVSAEAMVGFLNAYEITGDDQFYQHSIKSWSFIKKFLLDKQKGEWHWGVWDNYSPMSQEDKIGFWKCPYHNVRACIEVVKRLNALSLVHS